VRRRRRRRSRGRRGAGSDNPQIKAVDRATADKATDELKRRPEVRLTEKTTNLVVKRKLQANERGDERFCVYVYVGILIEREREREGCKGGSRGKGAANRGLK
jgi:hypothetical protein